MSGTGKSTLVHELRQRGHMALDADEDGYGEPREDGRWGWRADRVASLLAQSHDGPSFFAGCSGSDDPQLSQVLADVAEVEPLLRRSADLVLTTTAPPSELADAVLRYIA